MNQQLIEAQRPLFEAAVIERMKESGFLEVEIRVECLGRSGGNYHDSSVDAYWHFWQKAVAGIAVALPVGPKTLPTGDVAAVERCNVIHNTVRACRKAVEAAGVTVLPGAELKP